MGWREWISEWTTVADQDGCWWRLRRVFLVLFCVGCRGRDCSSGLTPVQNINFPGRSSHVKYMIRPTSTPQHIYGLSLLALPPINTRGGSSRKSVMMIEKKGKDLQWAGFVGSPCSSGNTVISGRTPWESHTCIMLPRLDLQKASGFTFWF